MLRGVAVMGALGGLKKSHLLLAGLRDRGYAQWLTDGHNDRVRAGRLLFVVSGVVVVLVLPMITPAWHDAAVVLLISAVMTMLLGLSYAVPWSRLSPKAALAFPASVMVALAFIGLFTTADVGSCYLGLFVLAYCYVGVFLPRGSGLLLLPLAAPTYVATIDRLDSYVLVRLVVGACIWVLVAELLATLSQRRDVLMNALKAAANTDVLTGVGNRRDIHSRLQEVKPGDTLVMVDLDHFKRLNDTEGHLAGDKLLADFGATLRLCLRGEDYAGRYGGEEFLLILSETDDAGAIDVLDRIRRKWGRNEFGVTFSAGFASHLGGQAATTLKLADSAVYQAKELGRDRSVAASDLKVMIQP